MNFRFGFLANTGPEPSGGAPSTRGINKLSKSPITISYGIKKLSKKMPRTSRTRQNSSGTREPTIPHNPRTRQKTVERLVQGCPAQGETSTVSKNRVTEQPPHKANKLGMLEHPCYAQPPAQARTSLRTRTLHKGTGGRTRAFLFHRI